MKSFIISTLFLFLSISPVNSQWASPGSNPTTTDPEIQGSTNPFLRFDLNDDTPGPSSVGGIDFRAGTSPTTEQRLWYAYDRNSLQFGSDYTDEDDVHFSVDADRTSISHNNNGYVNIGPLNSIHLTFDNNEIQAKLNEMDEGDLNINTRGGKVKMLDAATNSNDLDIDGGGFYYDNSANFVGIGTDTPSQLLDIHGYTDQAAYQIFHNNDTGSMGNQGLLFGINATEDGVLLNYQIGSEIFIGTEGTFDLTVDSDGDIGIGTLNPAFELQVVGDVDISGELTAASDIRLKKDIQKLKNGLSIIEQLSPVSYNFRTDEFNTMKLPEGRKMGLIAQEVEKILPQLVVDSGQANNSDGHEIDVKSLNYIELIPVLINAIQELSDEVDQLNQTVRILEARLDINDD